MNPKLNSSQQSAVDYKDGHLLIVAGPGTGKTHTLAHRIAETYQKLIDTQNILAITFTNKAAEAMEQRVQKLFHFESRRVFIGTFHQFCLHVLRTFKELASLPRDFVVETPEQILDLSELIWPDRSTKERKSILEQISRHKSSGRLQSFILADELDRFLRKRGILDYDDLLRETVKLLEENWSISHQMHLVYPQIFVDEYQDINAIQHKLLRVLVDEGVTITAIGDPNQAIYGFRGSHAGFFNSFQKDFPGAAVISLTENYRSAENLLSASSQIIKKGKGSGMVPALTANIIRKGRLAVHEAATDKAEAEYVVHSIEKMVGGTSMFSQDSGRVARETDAEYSFGDIIVLYRLNSQRFCLQEALERSGIPYHVSVPQSDDNEDEICPQRSEDVSVSGEKVSLMTLHAAKGLEFPVVFITGCEDSLLPLNLGAMIADLEEERRLFYVGMTRAKENLYLLRAQKRILYGRTMTNPASPFLADIEDELKSYEKEKQTLRKKKQEEQMSLF